MVINATFSNISVTS